jgi:hypothetical protein
MNSYYASLAIFCILAYLIVTDQSVARFIVLIGKLIEIRWARFYWWLKHNPANPIVAYQMKRRSMKLAEELMKELQDKQ